MFKMRLIGLQDITKYKRAFRDTVSNTSMGQCKYTNTNKIRA